MRQLSRFKNILLAICAIVLLLLLPSIPIVGDIWFEFGNVIPETVGLVHPVLPDEVIELNHCGENRDPDSPRSPVSDHGSGRFRHGHSAK